MSKFLRHESCPSCSSKDNLAVYDDHSYCFGCQYREQSGERVEETQPDKAPQFGLPKRKMGGLPDRGITPETVEKYLVSTPSSDKTDIEAVFPLFDTEGSHVANQVRRKEKKFSIDGDYSKAGVFGRHAFPPGQKTVTICEGHYDALAAYQMTGSAYPHVSVMSATSAKAEVVRDFEYLDSFEKIVINFDSDAPGQKAAKEVASLFSPGKAHILCLSKGKDANDYLLQGENYSREWWKAPPFMPDGLRLGTELLDDIINHKTPESRPYPFDGLNHKTYGLRLSEFVLITADTGVGKTSFLKEIEYSLLMDPELRERGWGVGFLHLEEPKYDTALGLMSIHDSKPYHLPDTEKTVDDLKKAFREVVDTKRVVIWDHFGSNDIDVVISKIRHMAALGVKYVFLDHLSIVVSDQSGDERKQLDEISTKLKTLTMNLDIACFCVIHINRKGEVRGSAGPEQVSNLVIRLERDKKDPSDWRRNIMRVSVEKNRFCGRTGPACHLFFNERTNRLEELPRELVEEYERGSTGAGHEFDAY